MKNYEEIIKKVKGFISLNKTGKALELLAKSQLSEQDKELIILNSRYSKLKEDQRLDLLDEDTGQRILNRINVDLLALADEIKKEENPSDANVAPVAQQKESVEKTKSSEGHKNDIPPKSTPAQQKQRVESSPTHQTTSKNNSKLYLIIGGILLLVVLAGWGIMQSNNKSKIADAAAKEKQEKTDEENKKKKETKQAADLAEKAAATERKKNIKLRNQYQGGTIFYIDDSGEHGLIMAPDDVQKTPVAWFAGPAKKIGAYGDGIYAGDGNTKKLVEAFGDGNYPAKLCADYVMGGYDDWYIPSKTELDLLWDFTVEEGQTSRTVVNHKGFAHKYYWSSTELSGNEELYYRSFFNSGKFYKIGRNKALIRAIRKF